MTSREQDAQTRLEIRKIFEETSDRARKAYEETKKKADIVYKEARKIATDKLTKKAADETYKKTINEAKKVRDAILAEALAVHMASYEQMEKGIK